MAIGRILLLFFWTSGTALSADSSETVLTIVSLLRQSLIVILGETHRKPESPRLVADVAKNYLESGGCLTVALEIAADQQPALHAGVQGTMLLFNISIHPIIDHPPYREMLRRFHALTRAGRCLKVRAVDSPKEHVGLRDHWMAKEIQALITHGPALVLVGNLHALKRVRWESGKDDPYLAEHLTRQGISALSILQEWEPNCMARKSRLLDVRHPRATTALQSTMDIVAVHPPEELEELVDHVLLWECAGL